MKSSATTAALSGSHLQNAPGFAGGSLPVEEVFSDDDIAGSHAVKLYRRIVALETHHWQIAWIVKISR